VQLGDERSAAKPGHMELIRVKITILCFMANVTACTGDYRGSADGATDQDGRADADDGSTDARLDGPCDLADPSSCGGSMLGCVVAGCVVPNPLSSACKPDGGTACTMTGTNARGDVCYLDTDCAPGQMCRITSGPIDCSAQNCVCTPWCRWPSGPCPTATTCHGSGSVKYNNQAYGECY
jgi:hypothetical protein